MQDGDDDLKDVSDRHAAFSCVTVLDEEADKLVLPSWQDIGGDNMLSSSFFHGGDVNMFPVCLVDDAGRTFNDGREMDFLRS